MSIVDNDYVALQDAAAADGPGTPVKVDGVRAGEAIVQVTVIGSGSLNVEGSVDGTSWHVVRVEDLSDGSFATTITASGIYRVDTAGLGAVRAPLTGYSSGAVTALFRHQRK